MGRRSKPSIAWFMWLLLVGSFELETLVISSRTPLISRSNDMSSRVAPAVQPPLAAGRRDDKVVIEKEKLVRKTESNLNYMMSKRRVPNGPDPIHNRRAGNSKRPPGRA
ncbi:CLAVATA3/ESR (CLE)-related protein 25 [Linum perenne]